MRGVNMIGGCEGSIEMVTSYLAWGILVYAWW